MVHTQEAINSEYRDSCVSLWFEKGDILSAVEWLKKKLQNKLDVSYNKPTPINFCNKTIDEAFEDIIKKKKIK